MMRLNKNRLLLVKLLCSHSLFIFGRMFFEIFMSIFIWKSTKNLYIVAWFNIVYLLSHTLSFTLFAIIGKKKGTHWLRRGALAGITITYLLIYLLSDESINYLAIIGFLAGIFNGMYWIGYKIFRFDLTHIDNRSLYTGMEKALKISIGIIAPILGGVLIHLDLFGSGYSNIFLFGAILFIGSFIIGHNPLPINTHKTLNLKKTYSQLIRNHDIVKSMMSYFFSGISRSGCLIRALIPLFMFNILQSEVKLGGILSLFSLVSVIASVTIGKGMKHEQYKFAVTFGGILLFISISSIISYPLLITFILFGILKENLFVLIDIPKKVMSENLIHCIDNHVSHRIEYMVIREWLQVGIGRVVSYLILLFANGLTIDQMQYVLLIMAIIVIVETSLLRSINTGNIFGLKKAAAI